jgi:hypothetical protein
MDEGTGTLLRDASGNSNNGNINVNNLTYTWVSGKVGNTAINWQPTCSTNCSSIDSYATVNFTKSQSLANGTFAAWVKPATAGNIDTLFRASDGSDAIALDSTGRVWFSNSYPNSVNCNFTAPAGAWSLIAATFDGTTIRCFQNATQIASGTPPNPSPESFTAIHIATRDDAYASYYQGSMDDLRIYNRAFSVAEIQALYNAEK